MLDNRTFFQLKLFVTWNSLLVQWLGLGIFHCLGPGSIPGWGIKIPKATWCGQKKFFFSFLQIFSEFLQGGSVLGILG